MKVLKLTRILFLLSAVLLISASCKKDDDSKSNACNIDSFTVDGVAWSITGTNITCTYPAETEEGLLTPVIVLSPGASISPASGVEQNFFTEAGVTYTVTAEDGVTRSTYIAKASVGAGLVGEVLPLGDGSDAYEIKSNQTLTYPNTYILSGFVYVTSGVTLTIEPGVIIKGDKASKGTLIVERGAKINAEGAAEKPIVFTSNQAKGQRKPGDWGGLILLGKAPNNAGEQTIEGGVRSQHGGSDAHDNSGILKYVRVEFAGIEYSTDNEINGITLGSIGDATTIDCVQVSYSGDDSFEWFGGTVNAKHLVAYHGWDDDFDTDNGFSGKIQFALSVRNPKIGDKSASNSFESDNNSGGTTQEPYTGAVFANVSLFGPVANPSSYTDEAGGNGSSVDARFQAGLHLRRNTQLSVFNSLIASFPVGIIIENDKGSTTQQWATDGKLNVAGCCVAGVVKPFQNAQYWKSNSVYNPDDDGEFVDTYFNRQGGGNQTFATVGDLKLTDSYFPASDSPLATGAGWTNTKVSSWFEKVAYRGAFSTSENANNSWMKGWTNFDPQNTDY